MVCNLKKVVCFAKEYHEGRVQVGTQFSALRLPCGPLSASLAPLGASLALQSVVMTLRRFDHGLAFHNLDLFFFSV